jgi:hypothetical protein
MTNRYKASIFAIIHCIMQIVLFIIGFGIGEALFGTQISTLQKTMLSILYAIISVITFPVLYLAIKYQISGLGFSYFILNSIIWAVGFYYLLQLLGYIKSRAGQ